MAPPVEHSLVDSALSLAQEAGELTLKWFRNVSLEVNQKSDGTPVTNADVGAEELIRARLADQFPDDGIFGEEEGISAGTSGRRWVIDPIDGTKAFTQGVPLYCNLLALEDEHGPALGIINVPAIDEVVYAGRGLGCWWNGQPARVSERSETEGAYLTTSAFSSWEESHLLDVKRAGFKLRTWGDGYGYLLAATGRVEVMVDPWAAYWDLAAATVIVPEAGGAFSDWAGDVTADGTNAVASNGLMHQQVLDLLNASPIPPEAERTASEV